MDPKELFEMGEELPVDNGDLQPADVIDIEAIEDNAKKIAAKLVNKIKKIYFTNSDLKDDGYAQTIVDRAIDSIAILEKMLICNNNLQDKLMINCCLNSGNNGLFMSLARIQDEIIDIQKQITKELTDLHQDLNDIKNADIEDDEDDNTKEIETKTAFRGGKDFLKSMIDDE